MPSLPRTTFSVCPVCLRTLPATLTQQGNEILLSRQCPDHGPYTAVVWRGEPSFESWQRPKQPATDILRQSVSQKGCPHDCGLCPRHGQRSCTVLLEVTQQCNLRCPVCFADAGASGADFTPLDNLVQHLHWIRAQAGPIILQLSGGEPTLYPHLPELISLARTLFPAVQLNTNGLLLAQQPEYAARLQQAGLSWVFLQFDGTHDTIFTALRGQPLLAVKRRAIDHCAAAGLPVVLVPTLVGGVNDADLGNLLRLALSLRPAVRGLHLQPMTPSGRTVFCENRHRLTLPEVLTALCAQSEGQIQPEHALPPGCEHELCSFHCRYRVDDAGRLHPLRIENSCCPTPLPIHEGQEGHEGAGRAVETVLRVWGGSHFSGTDASGQAAHALQVKPEAPHAVDAFDAFIAKAQQQTFSVTCMAFQDAATLDLQRLQGCCVHVFASSATGNKLIPFCACNLTRTDGSPLYRTKQASPQNGRV